MSFIFKWVIAGFFLCSCAFKSSEFVVVQVGVEQQKAYGILNPFDQALQGSYGCYALALRGDGIPVQSFKEDFQAYSSDCPFRQYDYYVSDFVASVNFGLYGIELTLPAKSQNMVFELFVAVPSDVGGPCPTSVTEILEGSGGITYSLYRYGSSEIKMLTNDTLVQVPKAQNANAVNFTTQCAAP